MIIQKKKSMVFRIFDNNVGSAVTSNVAVTIHPPIHPFSLSHLFVTDAAAATSLLTVKIILVFPFSLCKQNTQIDKVAKNLKGTPTTKWWIYIG